jgi:hypothetical protein
LLNINMEVRECHLLNMQNATDVNQRRWLAVEKRKAKDEQDNEASAGSEGGTREVQ